jgi:hypothetical protein
MSDWTGNKKALFVTNGDSSHSQQSRADWDYYATDPRAVTELLKRETFCDDILEPACGGGHISEPLKRHGYCVESVDIVKRDYSGQIETADFLQRREKWSGDIITNPPYKYAAEFVQQAMKIIDDGHKVAMFLKLTFLEGEKRRALFQQSPPRKIYVFTNRINCALNGNAEDFKKSSAVCYAWFIWEKGSREKPVIEWI